MMNTISQDIINHGGIENYLYTQQHKTLLRFITCGNVDDGKSTLIGRLLYDSCQIYDDQLSILRTDSKKIGTQKNKLDLALLMDGLQAERIQGITIDVAYRYFFTEKRKFIIADTPGHVEYTRNMVTGASTSELAVLLVDARKGIQDQTKRHWFISVLLGIKHIIIAINKMDLVNYDKNIFERISMEYLECTRQLCTSIDTKFVPISALDGDNIVKESVNMQWYHGPSLLEILENTNIDNTISNGDSCKEKELRLPIQYVIRDNVDFRGYSGTVAAGSICVGQCVKTFPANIVSSVQRIIVSNKDQKRAWYGDAVTITLDNNIDISRGDIMTDIDADVIPVQYALVDVIWMKEEALKEGQFFDVKIATKIVKVQVVSIEHQIDVYSFELKKENTIPLNGIGLIKLLFNESMILDSYSCFSITGSMIFIDLLTNETVGAGMVRDPIKSNDIMKCNKNYSEFELALHNLMRFYFPHWKIQDLP